MQSVAFEGINVNNKQAHCLNGEKYNNVIPMPVLALIDMNFGLLIE